MGRRLGSALVVCGLTLAAAGCGREKAAHISLEGPAQRAERQAPTEKRLRIAVGGMITPKEGMVFYRDFLRYVQEKVGVRVEYVDREGYAEINALLKGGELEAAFVCSGPYTDGHAQFGLELLAAPQAYGRTVYHSYIIVPAGSPARSLDDLRGKRFAFTDPLSNTGKLVPTYLLARQNETPESFFSTFVYTSAHDLSIKAVAEEVVDGAAVDSLIWDYLNRTDPKHTARTRIVAKSPPYGIPPLVVPPTLDPQLKKRLRQIVLGAHEDPTGRQILKKMMIDRFVPADDSAYDSIREMKAWVAKQAPGKRERPGADRQH